jgi:hypothetical protein
MTKRKTFLEKYDLSKLPYLPLLLLLAATAATFGNSLHHQFLASWDDYAYVLKNPDVRGISVEHLRAAFSSFYFGNYAPLHIVSYMMDYTLWGLNPAGYIGANIALHALNGLLFYALVAKLVGSARVAFFSVFLFLLHPVQVESVIWIAQRKSVLAMFFFLSSLLAYVNYRRKESGQGHVSYVVALASFVCALLTKSVVVVLPIVLLLHDFCFLSREQRRRWLADKIPFFAAAAAVALITLKSQSYGAGGGMVDYPDESAYRIFLTMLTVFSHYGGLLFWPQNLSIVYDTPIKAGIDTQVALSGILMLTLCAGLYYLLRKQIGLFFWAVLIPVGLLPVSQIIPLATLMNDRYLYFPMLGFAVLFAWVTLFCLDRLLPGKAPMMSTLLCLVLLALPILSWQRSLVWFDSISLWSDAVDKYPNFVTYAGMGNALYQAGKINEAVVLYNKSLALEPSCEEALRSLGVIYLNGGEYDKALFYLEQFVNYYPDNTFGQKTLAILYQQIKR